jgi:hypothetical protein
MKLVLIVGLSIIIIIMLYYNTRIIEGAPLLPSGSNQASVNTIEDMRTFLEQMYMITILNSNDTSNGNISNTTCYKISQLGTYLWPILGPFTEWSLEELSPIFGVPMNPTSIIQGAAEQNDTSTPPIPIITNDDDYQKFIQLAALGNMIRPFSVADYNRGDSVTTWYKDGEKVHDGCKERWGSYASSINVMNAYYLEIASKLAYFHAQTAPKDKLYPGDSIYTALYYKS